MEELEHEIEVAAAAEEPEQPEDELAGEPEEENTGKHRLLKLLAPSSTTPYMYRSTLAHTSDCTVPSSALKQPCGI